MTETATLLERTVNIQRDVTDIKALLTAVEERQRKTELAIRELQLVQRVVIGIATAIGAGLATVAHWFVPFWLGPRGGAQ